MLTHELLGQNINPDKLERRDPVLAHSIPTLTTQRRDATWLDNY